MPVSRLMSGKVPPNRVSFVTTGRVDGLQFGLEDEENGTTQQVSMREGARLSPLMPEKGKNNERSRAEQHAEVYQLFLKTLVIDIEKPRAVGKESTRGAAHYLGETVSAVWRQCLVALSRWQSTNMWRFSARNCLQSLLCSARFCATAIVAGGHQEQRGEPTAGLLRGAQSDR